MLKLAEVLPVGTCTKPSVESVKGNPGGGGVWTSTSIPGAGAGAVNVTVPVTLLDPTRNVGLTVKLFRVTGAGCKVTV